MFKVTLFLLLLAAAAGEKAALESAAAAVSYAAAPTAAEPALELVEDTEPLVEEPAAEEPAVEEPVVEELAVEEVSVEEPAAEEATVEEPAAEEATVEEPAAEEAAVEEPAAEEVTVEEPAAEEAAVEEPAAEEATVEEPAAEEATVEEPATKEPSYEDGQPQEPNSYYQPVYGYQQLVNSDHHSAYDYNQPSYGHHQPSYGKTHKPAPPACSLNTSHPWCLEDAEYPTYRIAKAITLHHYTFASMYKDVVADTANSVDRLQELQEESYLCSSRTSYVQPLRAQDTDGKWRIIVNGVRLHDYTFTQTARLEECLAAGEPCPLVPECYESTCLQKSAVHRFLVFDEYDHYQPFAIETFKLPSACACALGAYQITH